MSVAWIAAVDRRRGTLFECTRTSGGEWHVAQRREVSNLWESCPPRERLGAVGRGSGASAVRHVADATHEAEEIDLRFARTLANWLRDATPETGGDRVTVFAPPKFVAKVRDAVRETGLEYDVRERELTHLHPSELSEHPAVVELLETT
ncbi:hypothetical protein PHYC_01946 [Phycisphaerales bacterium]|nr:hypothetical protein PHYC_01946 [Phycisphaerales bacterium]